MVIHQFSKQTDKKTNKLYFVLEDLVQAVCYLGVTCANLLCGAVKSPRALRAGRSFLPGVVILGLRVDVPGQTD